jgi:hypothetical protein
MCINTGGLLNFRKNEVYVASVPLDYYIYIDTKIVISSCCFVVVFASWINVEADP